MEEPMVRAWVEGYRRAWESNDPAEIGALFTGDATYQDHPLREPRRGRDAIVQGWLGALDEPGTTTFRWETVAVDGDVAVVRGWTSYAQPAIDYSNIWVLRLADDGRCASFTEWWMEQERS